MLVGELVDGMIYGILRGLSAALVLHIMPTPILTERSSDVSRLKKGLGI